ncbi:hypothetical protein GCM10009759_66480 [Kitasatospora saccharophila]|uniref:Uncharacterized protein n=1 Tax=Kitasatospora saccharophila TaxID=407973 RepID=A0ABN2XZK0_9ACTN
MTEQWEPQEGRPAYDQCSGRMVRIISVHAFGAFVRPLRGGREALAKLPDLVSPEDRADFTDDPMGGTS